MATRDWHNEFTMQNFPLPSQNTTKTHLNYWQETQVFVELSLTPVFSCLSLTKYDYCLNIWKICMWQRRDRRSLRARPSLSARKVSKSLGGCGCHLSHIMLQLDYVSVMLQLDYVSDIIVTTRLCQWHHFTTRLCQWHHCHVTTRLCQWHHVTTRLCQWHHVKTMAMASCSTYVSAIMLKTLSVTMISNFSFQSDLCLFATLRARPIMTMWLQSKPGKGSKSLGGCNVSDIM